MTAEQYIKKYNTLKALTEVAFAIIVRPITRFYVSWQPNVPLASSRARAEREAVATNIISQHIEPPLRTLENIAAVNGKLICSFQRGETLNKVVSIRENSGLEDVARALGTTHARLAHLGYGIGDGGWQNVLVSRDLRHVVLIDFEHFILKDDAKPAWHPIDDIFESIVTTAILTKPSPKMNKMIYAYVNGIANESLSVARGLVKLFSERRYISRFRCVLSSYMDSDKSYRNNFNANYKMFANAFRGLFPKYTPIEQSIIGLVWRRIKSRLQGVEYNGDPDGYDQYSRRVEDRDGLTVRAIMALQSSSGTKYLNNNTKILEVGGGTGIVSRTILDCIPSAKATILDISKPALQYASRDERIACHYGDMNQIYDLVMDDYSLIIFASSLRYSLDGVSVLSEIKRLTKHNATLIVFPSDFGKVNSILYRKHNNRDAKSVINTACAAGWLFDAAIDIPVRRGSLGPVIIFSKYGAE